MWGGKISNEEAIVFGAPIPCAHRQTFVRCALPCATNRWLEPGCAQVTGCTRTSLTKRFGPVKGLHLVKIAKKKTVHLTRVYTVYTAYDFMPSLFVV